MPHARAGIILTIGPHVAALAVMEDSPMNTTPSGLQYLDTVVGEGAEAKAGQDVVVHYTGWLYKDGEQGAKFDSSKDRGQPFVFPLGAGHVIKGWDEGVQGMAVGGVRRLTGKTLIVSDVDGVQYLIRDPMALDRHSRKLLDRFM